MELRLPDFLRTSTFRMAATFAVAFAVSAAFLFAFIYWQTAVHETNRIDKFLTTDAAVVAGQPADEIYQAVSLRIMGDLHRITYAALFDRSGRRIAGNLAAAPAGLPADGKAHSVASLVTVEGAAETGAIRAVGQSLPDGNLLILGRNVDALQALQQTVLRALELGVVPAMVLAIAAGAFVSWRAQRRIKEVHRAAERIMYGNLRERLPTHGTNDDFDRLAQSVNLMLDEIGRLLDNMKQAGNDIAHDLRVPLARLRARLERSRETARDHQDLRASVDAAIHDLDQALAVITTLLRIGEIESGRRRLGFAEFDLGALADEVAQIYQPLAEEKAVALESRIEQGLVIFGDRGLMVEAVANLLQNAIKFTPGGGHVSIAALALPEGSAVRVADDGPGIAEAEHERVFDRFYRAEKSRHTEGSGLGLSLVNAIVRFHGFKIELCDNNPGALFEIVCPVSPAAA
jgi:signal transduction histidine kinase